MGTRARRAGDILGSQTRRCHTCGRGDQVQVVGTIAIVAHVVALVQKRVQVRVHVGVEADDQHADHEKEVQEQHQHVSATGVEDKKRSATARSKGNTEIERRLVREKMLALYKLCSPR